MLPSPCERCRKEGWLSDSRINELGPVGKIVVAKENVVKPPDLQRQDVAPF